MSGELKRIGRSIARAEAAYTALSSTADIDVQQAAWEEFLSDWRTSLNQIAAQCKKQGRHQIAEAMNGERMSNGNLDYVWEARNAEEHTPDGTSLKALTKVHHPFTFNGEAFTFNGQPFTFAANEEVLCFRDLSVRRNGIRVSLPAPAYTPADLAREAIEYLRRSHSKLIEAG